jgi:hypothetical protein
MGGMHPTSTFDLSDYRHQLGRNSRGLAYFAWGFAVALGVLALVTSGLIGRFPPDPGHRAFGISAGFSTVLVVLGIFFYGYTDRRIQPTRLDLASDRARFTLIDGTTEEVPWRIGAGTETPASARTMWITDWSGIQGIEAERRFMVAYRVPGHRLRIAPLPPEAFTSILASWRAFGCPIAEEKANPRGRLGLVSAYSM